MTQLSIDFNAQRARGRDPITSHYAAVRAKRFLGAQASRVLEALKKFPGSTSAELAQLAGLDRYMVARRLPDLEKCDYVSKGSIRECKATGSKAVTWFEWKEVMTHTIEG